MLRFVRRTSRVPLVLTVAAFIFNSGAIAPAHAADRKELPLEKAIVGHWRTHSGETDYYFAADGKLLMAWEEGKERQAQRYEVVGSDKTEKVLRVKIKVVSTGKGHEKELRFSSDAQTLMETIRIAAGEVTIVGNTTWHYVGDDQAPPKDKADR